MMVMLPMMFAARKLDGEDPNIVFMLRCAYGAIQTLIILSALYVYMVASKISSSGVKDEEIYVSPPASVRCVALRCDTLRYVTSSACYLYLYLHLHSNACLEKFWTRLLLFCSVAMDVFCLFILKWYDSICVCIDGLI